MKKNKIFFIFFLVLSFSFSPIYFSNLFFQIKEYAVASDFQTISGYQEWTKDTEINGSIEIEKGAILTIREGATITFKKNSTLYVNGKLFVKGTKTEPVKFKMEGIDQISFGDDETIEYYGYRILVGGEAFFKNTDFSGGGDIFQQYLKGNSILNKTYAADFGGVIVVQGGKLNVSECNFHDNVGGVQVQWVDDGDSVQVNKTIFDNNYSFDAKNDCGMNCEQKPNFRYNWWRGPNGPEIADAKYDIYKYISGNIDFSNWLQSKDFKDPVLIIPGILGSWKWTDGGEWRLDPVFGMYDNLLKTFDKNGYTEDENLFTFPYQWRDSNENNAILLKNKIFDIKQKTNWPSVDVVAHSMGGLLTREYIESDYYDNDVDQLITLGTPHNGAPEDYLTWDGGYINFSDAGIVNEFANFIFKQEAKEQGYNSIFKYIQNKPIKSVQELLPTYDYLYDVASDKLRSYFGGDSYPQNIFIEELNSKENQDKLRWVEFYNIVGKIENSKTINRIKVGEPSLDENSIWAHGYPENFDELFGDRGLEYGEGDGTVPIESASAVISDAKIQINSSHRKLPTSAAGKVFELINGHAPNENVASSYVDKIMVVFVFSPVDVQIISPSGKKYGKDFESNASFDSVGGSYYTGFDTENEFVTIPNPEDGEYKILTQGTGAGEYKIEVAKITENNEDPTDVTESTVEFSGTTEENKQDSFNIEVAGAEVVDKTKDTTPPTISAETISKSNANGWYNSDVTIKFTATDDESGIEDESEKNVVLSDEGENQSIMATFTDKAGNSASKTVSGINIDKTAPTTETEITGTEGDNNWYTSDVEIKFLASDNLSGISKIYSSLDGADFAEGNAVNITEEGKHTLQYYSNDLADSKEEEKSIEIDIDKTAPEAKIIFNKSAQELEIVGMDNISQNVSRIITEKEEKRIIETKERHKIFPWLFNLLKREERKTMVTAALVDEAGNRTEIVYEKKKDKNHIIGILPQSVSYNGQKTEFSKSKLEYSWMLDWWRRKYVFFGSHILNGDEKLESHYVAEFNETWIMEDPKELEDEDDVRKLRERPVWKKLPGMVVPYLETAKGELQIRY